MSDLFQDELDRFQRTQNLVLSLLARELRAADALEAAEATIANLEHRLQQADELATAAYKDAEAAEARSADLQSKLADLSNKVAAIRDHCQDNLKARSMGDYENGYDGACLDILDILEAQ